YSMVQSAHHPGPVIDISKRKGDVGTRKRSRLGARREPCERYQQLIAGTTATGEAAQPSFCCDPGFRAHTPTIKCGLACAMLPAEARRLFACNSHHKGEQPR